MINYAGFASRLFTSRRSRAAAAQRASAGRLVHRDTHLTREQSPQGIGIDAQMPNSMPRAEDDAATRAGSREFHDRPGSGSDIGKREFFY